MIRASLLFLLLPAASASAQVVNTWTNGNATGLWSDAANWDELAAPAAGDIVLFDATSTANCSIDANATAESITVTGAYTGTITQQAGVTITLADGFSISGGAFAGGTAAITLLADLQISGGIFTSTSGTLTLGGNFAHTAGGFNHNNGSVVLTGASQSITGTKTFFNLTKTVAATATLSFQGGSTNVIAGSLTLAGAAGNPLLIRSLTPGAQCHLWPSGTYALANLDVRDSHGMISINAVGTGSVDSGNNFNWVFALLPEEDDDGDDCGSVGIDLLLPLGFVLLLRRRRS